MSPAPTNLQIELDFSQSNINPALWSRQGKCTTSSYSVLHHGDFVAVANAWESCQGRKRPNLSPQLMSEAVQARLRGNYFSYPINQCHQGQGEIDLAHKCALDICGVPKESPSRRLSDFNFDEYVQKGSMERFSEIENEAREMLEDNFMRNERFIRAFKKRLKQGDFRPNYDHWGNKRYTGYAEDFFDRYIVFEIDMSRPFHERLRYQISFPKDASEVMRKGIEQYARDRKSETENNLLFAIGKGLYTLEEALAVLNREWNEFYKKYKSEKKGNDNPVNEEERDIDHFREDITKATLDFRTIFDLAHHLDRLKRQMGYTSPNLWNWCRKETCRKAVREKFDEYDFQALVSELEQKNREKEKRFKQHLTYCKSAIALGSLKDFDRSALRGLIPEVESSFMKNVLAQYSEQSKSMFSYHLNNELKFYIDNSTFQLQGIIDEFKENYENFKKNNGTVDYRYYSDGQYIDNMLNYIDDYSGTITPFKPICSDRLSTLY